MASNYNYTILEIKPNNTVYDELDQLTPKSMSNAINTENQLLTFGFMVLLQIGYIILEYGSSRRKNSDTILIKSIVIFVFSVLSTYTLGYGFAYGSTYLIGLEDYFTPFAFSELNEGKQAQWLLMFAAVSLTAQMSVSGIMERAQMIVPFVFSIFISLLIAPFTIGWIHGKGFLYKLGLIDFSGCLTIHLISGFASFFGSLVIKSRFGRYEPLSIKRGQNSQEIYLAHQQKQNTQNKIESLVKQMTFQKEKSIDQLIQKARQIIYESDNDSFYIYNSEISIFLGSILMFISLCQLFSGYQLTVVQHRYEAEIAYINCFTAGICGGFSALISKKAFDFNFLKRIKRNFSTIKAINEYDSTTQMFNPYSGYDIFVTCRGMIAGCVSVSNGAIHYKIWVSAIVGLMGGVVYTGACFLAKKLKADDPMTVFQAHGVPACLGLVLVTFFHQNEGIFFTNIHDIISLNKTADIIYIFGANILSAVIVILWTALITIPFFLIIKRCCLRVSKVDELIGLDVTQNLLGIQDAQNIVQYIITEYYPENIGDFLRQKKRLLELSKKGKKKAKQKLSVDELKRIKELLDQEIAQNYGTEAKFLDEKDQDANFIKKYDTPIQLKKQGLDLQDTDYNKNGPQILFENEEMKEEDQLDFQEKNKPFYKVSNQFGFKKDIVDTSNEGEVSKDSQVEIEGQYDRSSILRHNIGKQPSENMVTSQIQKLKIGIIQNINLVQEKEKEKDSQMSKEGDISQTSIGQQNKKQTKRFK